MTKAITIVHDTLQNHYMIVTDFWIEPGRWAKVLHCFYDQKENRWRMSWNRSNVIQARKSLESGVCQAVKFVTLDEQLRNLIMQELSKKKIQLKVNQ